MENIINDLEQIMWDDLSEEGITKEDIELVDLEIGFSPVTPFRDSNPCEVTETVTGKYLVIHPLLPNAIGPEMLKIMRCRYLSNRKNSFI